MMNLHIILSCTDFIAGVNLIKLFIFDIRINMNLSHWFVLFYFFDLSIILRFVCLTLLVLFHNFSFL